MEGITYSNLRPRDNENLHISVRIIETDKKEELLIRKKFPSFIEERTGRAKNVGLPAIRNQCRNDLRMAVSLIVDKIDCLLEKLLRGRVVDVRIFEAPLYIGLDATAYFACSFISSAYVVDIVNRSRVLCLFKILYHKYIFLDVNSIFDLVQVLLCEGLITITMVYVDQSCIFDLHTILRLFCNYIDKRS
jgi:hypothetical protein